MRPALSKKDLILGEFHLKVIPLKKLLEFKGRFPLGIRN
jgi:hypothetical protein